MLNKACLVIISFFVIKQICQTAGKTLPTTIKGNYDGERKNPSTTYYRHNIFGPNTYAFGFEVNDRVSGNIQFRDERRYANGTTEGSYGYVCPDGSVMVTHFLADRNLGYLSQTQSIQPGDEQKWQNYWPTEKPNIVMEKPLDSIQSTLVYDDNDKLNLTSILLPVEPIKQRQGIDLNPPHLEKELLNPAVLEVINGSNSMMADKNNIYNTLNFEKVNQFIPPDFPIVPFRIPEEDVKINENEGLSTTLIPILKDTNDGDLGNKYDHQKRNSTGKNFNPTDNNDSSSNNKLIKSKVNNVKKSLSISAVNNEDIHTSSSQATNYWYDKIINQTRQKYLENLQ